MLEQIQGAGAYAGQATNPAWVDVTAEVGSNGAWNTFEASRVQGVGGSTNPNVSGVVVDLKLTEFS